MSGPEAPGVFRRGLLQRIIVAINSDQARPRRLAKCDAEFRVGTGGDHDFVEILRSLDEVALAEKRISTANTRIAAAEAAITSAEAALADLDLVATIDCTVVNEDLIVGQRVSPGQEVVRLADFSQWFVETDNLTEIEVVDIANGDTASITPDALPDLKMSGKVESISDEFEEKRGDITYTTRIRLDNADPRLRWGMTVAVVFDQ